MKTRKNVKGFTLVELIVVIAIIGVLAAILVPSMLGYVKKSKVSSANANAKSLYDAVATAVVELDSEGLTYKDSTSTTKDCIQTGPYTGTSAPTAKSDDDAYMLWKVNNFFDGIKKLKGGYAFRVTDMAVVAAVASDGTYVGSYPHVTNIDNATGTSGIKPNKDGLDYAAKSC